MSVKNRQASKKSDELPKLADFLEKRVVRLATVIVSILSLVIFFTFFRLTERSFLDQELSRVLQLEKEWSSRIDSFGKLLCVLSVQKDLFQDEEKLLKTLEEIYKRYSPLVAYPAFGRADGKMLSYPHYDYGPEYDTRKRPWYQAALQNPHTYVVVKPFMHAVLNEPAIAVVKAVLDENGEVLGVLGLDLVSSRLAEAFLTDGSYIVDETGQTIAKKGRIKAIFDPGSVKQDLTTHLSGLTHYVAKASIAGTYVVVEHSIANHLIFSLIPSLSVLGTLFVVNFFVSRRIRRTLKDKVVSPIEKITKAAQDYLSKRHFDLEHVEDDVYEIKMMINELSDMVTIIESQMQELEASYSELEASQSQIEEAYEILKRKENEIEQAYRAIVEKLDMIVEKFDEPTGKHVVRVSRLSRFLAEKLNLPNELVRQIELYSPLHDIGKIFVPKEILTKPGKLTKEEFEIVKTHTVQGASLFENDERFTVARNIILYHHERYDGSGYPFGLKNGEIPIEAQIVGLVDVYDALRSERPYKKPVSHEEALKVILYGDEKTNRAQFSPELLKVFLEHADEINKIWEECSSPAAMLE